MENLRMQWYVITAIGGQEESIANALREKMNNYGYANFIEPWKDDESQDLKDGTKPLVNCVKVFMKKEDPVVTYYHKNDKDCPSPETLKKVTKTTHYEALPDGRYAKIVVKTVNRFKGYVFVQTNLNNEIWYAIRNTVGVLGFVGSSGKGALPIPCAISEYQRLISQAAAHEYAARIEKAEAEKAAAEAKPKKEAKPVLTEAPFKVGESVELTDGSFAGTVANVQSINLEKQTAKVEFEFFGRVSTVEVNFSDVKKLAE